MVQVGEMETVAKVKAALKAVASITGSPRRADQPCTTCTALSVLGSLSVRP